MTAGGGGWKIKPFDVNLGKSLRMVDVGGWDSEQQIEHGLIKAGVIEPKDLIESRRLSGVAFWKWARGKVEGAGYKSVVYSNRLEDPGSNAYIVWHSNQIRPLK